MCLVRTVKCDDVYMHAHALWTLDTATASRLRRGGAVLGVASPELAPTRSLDEVVYHVVVLHIIVARGQRHVEPLTVKHESERQALVGSAVKLRAWQALAVGDRFVELDQSGAEL